MFDSTQNLVRKTANNLGYNLTDYRVEDITFRVENSPEVLKFSNELTLTKVIQDLKYFIIPSFGAFLLGLGFPFFNQAKVDSDFIVTGVSMEQSVASGVEFFMNSFSFLFSIELIWLMSNLFLEKRASNKMILHFLQIREDVRK
jgi:hypothetical protein